MTRQLTLIFTKHKESGNCNESALLKIIELVNPEVIFEELSNDVFHMIYKKQSMSTLESNSIKHYIKHHLIEHIPIDTYERTSIIDSKIDYLNQRIINGIGENSFHFRNLINQRCELDDKYGFQFLNSSEIIKFMESFNSIKNKFLLEKNDEKLNTIASLEKEVIDNREETMLRNNYNYSIENEYTTALFFIGSGHMHTILPKIKAWSEKEGNVINWLFYKDIKWS